MLASFKSQKALSVLILMAFIAVAVLSFTMMMHESNGGLANGCLFATGETTLCSSNVLALVMHHISAYQAFINVPVSFGWMSILFFLLLAVLVVLITRLVGILNLSQSVLIRNLSNSPPETSYKRKIIGWLSLFENSPSVFKNV